MWDCANSQTRARLAPAAVAARSYATAKPGRSTVHLDENWS